MSRKHPNQEPPKVKTNLEKLKETVEEIRVREDLIELSLHAKGVQTFMSVELMGLPKGGGRKPIRVASELKELTKIVRLETADHIGRPWYSMTITSGHGHYYKFQQTNVLMDRVCEPRPHGAMIPPEDLFLDYVEFPRFAAEMPPWVVARL